VLGGLIASTLLASPDPYVHIAEATRTELAALGISDFRGLVPSEFMSWQGLLTPAGLVMIVLGGFVISLNEARQPSAIGFPTLPVELALATPLPPLATAIPSLTFSPTIPATPTETASPSPTPCTPPTDWVEYQVQEGDKLRALARTLHIAPEELLAGNCADKLILEPGMTILIPPSGAPTAAACNLATGWYPYVVKLGDTLYSLARRIDSSVDIIITGNCLTSDRIYTGQVILLPKLPPVSYPTATPTMKPLPTNTQTDTVGPISRGTATPILPYP